MPGGRRGLKLLNNYPYVKGFKLLHICNPTKHAKTPKALIRFLISVVISPLWKGELIPTTKHSNLTAFSEISQFIVGGIRWQWSMFFQSSFELVWTTSLLLWVIRSLACVLLTCWHEARRYYFSHWASWIFNMQSLNEPGLLINRSQKDYRYTDLLSFVPCSLRYLVFCMYFNSQSS